MVERAIREAPFRWSDVEIQMKKAFGDFCTLVRAEQIHAGERKLTYRLEHRYPQNFCILMVWPGITGDGDEEDQPKPDLYETKQAELFVKNSDFLHQNGIFVPEVFQSGKLDNGLDYALVQAIEGLNSREYLSGKTDLERQRLMVRVGETVSHMHSLARNWHGPLLDVTVPSVPYADLMLQKADQALDMLGRYHQLARQGLAGLRKRLEDLRLSMAPRSVYRFIHGDLKPEHILITPEGQPYLIGFETAQYADLEQEHSDLSYRFGVDYRYFSRQDLDEQRLLFYKLCSNIWRASGAAQLLTRGYANIQEVQAQLNLSLKEALKLL